jgi:acyl carrier protein
LEHKLKTIMAEALTIPMERIDDSTTMDNVDTWDSLRHMELVVAIEQSFQIEFSAEEFIQMTSFAEIKRVLGDKGVQI